MATGDKLPIGITNRRELLPERVAGTPFIPNGYQGNNIPNDFNLPPATIEDVDRALFNFFNKSINLQVQMQNNIKTVPTIFAGGERFALTKSGRPIRDRRGAIIVPVVAIKRTNISQGSNPNMAFGSDPGELVIRRRIHKGDRRYQQLRNRFNLKNQDNVASDNNLQDLTAPGTLAKEGKVASRRDHGGQPLQTALDNPIGDNIIETIVIPTPNFITINYEITVWTNYVQEMNQIIERVLSSYEIGSLYTARIESSKGYWYVAYFDDTWNTGDNFEDYTGQQRLIKSTINVKVPAWTLVSQGAGEGIPIRSYVSAPKIDFEVCETDTLVESLINRMPMIGSDDPAFILNNVEDVGIDGRIQTGQIGSGLVAKQYVFNPFATQRQGDPRFARIICVSKKGERVGKTIEALSLGRITKP